MRCNKLYFLTCLLCITLLGTSCEKWLDVSPARQVKEEEQFSSRQGFIDALFGIYQGVAADSAYGRNLSLGLLDILAQRYENKGSGSWYDRAARYNYTSEGGSQFDVRDRIGNVWSYVYAAVAQANYILRNTDAKKGLLGGDMYNIVKGESLGMRGFLHFDLLRLFAPAYLNGAAAQAQAIPYMQEFTIKPQDRLTVDEILAKCEADLLEAETLLAVYQNIDQIADNQGAVSAELFLMYRQNHLNYWAVKAVLARLYLYKGDKVNALKYATEVINSEKFRFITPEELNTDPNSTASDLTFTREHIFSLYVSGMKKLSDDIFKPGNASTEDQRDLYSTKAKLDAMYETSVPGYGTDIRIPAAAKSLWNQVSNTVVYTKKYYADNANNVKQRLVPVIKLAEMYYIAAEAAASPDAGLVYLNQVRTARLLPALEAPVTTEILDAELEKEYRKEFYGEGQLWYYYKRKNTVTIPDGVGNPMTPEKYLFPIPLSEIEFGK